MDTEPQPRWAPQPGPQAEAIAATWCQELLYGGAAGGGKALSLDTPIATPHGWTPMGELQPGDAVFDENGTPCNVVAVSRVMHNRPCWRLTFSDGAEIIADAQHQWATFTAAERNQLHSRTEAFRAKRREGRPSRAKAVSQKPGVSVSVTALNRARVYSYELPPTGSLRTTEEIAQTLWDGRHRNHAVAVAGPLQCAEADLLIDPYVLGVWLGDGSSYRADVTSVDTEIVAELASAGHAIRPRPKTPITFGVGGLKTALVRLALIGNKHIPPAYLRASVSQRLSLLQGLMDTDGHCNMRGHCEFSVARKQLADGLFELLASLGIKAAIAEGRATLDGRVIGPKYTLKFLTELQAFRLPRKLIRQKRGQFRGTHGRRYIVAAEPIASVPVRCIQVDSPSHLYLAGRQMIPTHNSDFLLGDYLQDVPTYAESWQGVLFRRTYRELEELITRSLELYPQTGGVWEASKDRWIWPNGAMLRLRYLERDVDVTRYQGHAYTFIGYDELGQFPSPYAYRYLRSRLRSAKPVPTKRIRATANPGGSGHHWLKAMFIDPAPLGFQPLIDPETGAERMFVPSRLTDNQILLGADPHYAQRLKGMGSPELVRAMLEGDWSVIVGSFFPEFELHKHVIPVFTPPEHWLRFRSFDWGSARPFAVGWWAQVADGGRWPTGALIKYREWYGSTGEPNVGLRLTAEQVADGIKARESGDQIAYGVADPSIFAQDGGPSIAERMFARGVTWRPADNTRIARHGAMGGWDLFRQRLRGEDGKPMAYWMSCCRDAIRTIPAMQHDDARPEDLASELEDHAVDADRYAFASRPWMPAPESAKPPPLALGEIRADMLMSNAPGGRI